MGRNYGQNSYLSFILYLSFAEMWHVTLMAIRKVACGMHQILWLQKQSLWFCKFYVWLWCTELKISICFL